MKQILGVLGFVLVVSGCGLVDLPAQKGETSQFRKDGMVAVSRSVPSPVSAGSAAMLGFAPSQIKAGPGTWLSVNRNDRKLVVLDGASVVTSVSGDGMELLQPGSYKVVHKQRSPLWYAPDNYFASRLLVAPPQNHPERFRRGALGDFAVFLDGDVTIHSGALWTEDVGGIRLSESDMAKLYYSIAVGSSLEVQ